MSNQNQPTQEVQTFEDLDRQHDAALTDLIKEIKDLADGEDKTNDKIENGIIVNDQLNDGLKSYLDNNKNVATLLLNHVRGIDASNISEDAQESLQKLITLLSGVVNGPVEGNESVQEVANPSFDKFRKMIEEGKLNKLNTLKDREVQDVIKYVNDNKNDISSLNLFADMLNQQALHGGDRNFRHTDRKNFYDVLNAVKSHFNMPESAGVDTAKDLQLGKIFEGKSTKDDLSKIAKDYLGVDNWDGNNLEQNPDGKYAEGVKLIVDYAKFVNKFNELNAARIASETPATPDVTPAVEIPEVSDGGFDKVVDKEKVGKRMDQKRVDAINKCVNEVMGGEGKEFLKFKGEEGEEQKLTYNIENVKNFLKTINKDNFKDYYTKPGEPKRYAWLSAVQLLLSQDDSNKDMVIDGEYKRKGQTWTAVSKFQGEYNKSKMVDDKYPDGFKPLVEDGIPGPLTLGKMLEDKPVAEPTGEPVAEPTGEPVAEPTGEPVAEPTDEPVAEPTGEPVAEPTGEPVAEEEWHPPMAAPEDQAHTNDGEYTRGNNQTRVGNGWTKPRGTS